MQDLVPISRALISVSDKNGIVELCRALSKRGVEIISTGGTASALSDAKIPVRSIDDVTGFPEMLDGRVKTLHPKVHGGILGRRDLESHLEQMQEHEIAPIDLICVNLYPFEQTVARPDVSEEDAIEQIDIGGPALIRSAAKNHASVTVLTDPAQYERLLAELNTNDGATTLETRRRFAAEAFARTASYDTAITSWFAGQTGEDLPGVLEVRLTRTEQLRYGENPHQKAAVYRRGSAAPDTDPSLVDAGQLHGKPLSYNNLLDASAALALGVDLSRSEPETPCAVVVKHTNPCGAARAQDSATALDAAIAGDPVAAYGGIVALSARVDAATAERLCAKDIFLEVVVAPSFEDDALAMLRDRWKNLRLLAVGPFGGSSAGPPVLTVRSILGGHLVQQRDDAGANPARWTHSAGPAPTDDVLRQAADVWLIAKHLTSNAIAIGGADAQRSGAVRLFGAGPGQVDRVTACRLATEKAGQLTRGAVAASDAFFPFPDGPELLIDAGVSLIVHPGGSKRDDETFALCNDRGVTCMTTGTRHFRH
jgi:phosphoribosylaminoimidazolecarboxamide formyltransferase/IMP cyclohydrolase